MGTHGSLLTLRIKLDNAITYGTKKQARALARQGLEAARRGGLKAEEEYFKGQLDILGERFASAIEHFDAAIRLNPRDGASYNDRALCMVELGIIEEAFYYFDKGIEVEPDYATIYHNKGWLLNNIGRHTEAIRYLKKALELQPRRAVTYDNLADAFLNLGQYRAARDAYKKVLALLKPGECRSIRKKITEQVRYLERFLRDEDDRMAR